MCGTLDARMGTDRRLEGFELCLLELPVLFYFLRSLCAGLFEPLYPVCLRDEMSCVAVAASGARTLARLLDDLGCLLLRL